MNPSSFYNSLADILLVTHFFYVAFVVGGLLFIWAGYFRHWAFVRNFWFRLAHLLAMGVVVAESLIGAWCPLTKWENILRTRAGEGQPYPDSFVLYWIHRVMFYDFSPGAFTLIYAVFFSLVLLSLWLVKPYGPSKKRAIFTYLILFIGTNMLSSFHQIGGLGTG